MPRQLLLLLLMTVAIRANFQPFNARRSGQAAAAQTPLTIDQLKTKLAQLEAENARLLARNPCRSQLNFNTLKSELEELDSKLESCRREKVAIVTDNAQDSDTVDEIMTWRAAERRITKRVEHCELELRVERTARRNASEKLDLAKRQGARGLENDTARLDSITQDIMNYQGSLINSFESLRARHKEQKEEITELLDQLDEVQTETEAVLTSSNDCKVTEEDISDCKGELRDLEREVSSIEKGLTASEETNVELSGKVIELNGQVSNQGGRGSIAVGSA